MNYFGVMSKEGLRILSKDAISDVSSDSRRVPRGKSPRAMSREELTAILRNWLELNPRDRDHLEPMLVSGTKTELIECVIQVVPLASN